MASTSTAPPGTPTSAEFAGDNFSNNLFSDLAPLLTLFGEQVTKQFLSLTLGWADHILLAMGPLGIITIVVSAIRVSGPKKLKAMIGRSDASPHNIAMLDGPLKYRGLIRRSELVKAPQQPKWNFCRPPPMMSVSSGTATRLFG